MYANTSGCFYGTEKYIEPIDGIKSFLVVRPDTLAYSIGNHRVNDFSTYQIKVFLESRSVHVITSPPQ